MRYRSKPAEVEAMQWVKPTPTDVLWEVAEQIVAWVNANGGEARYYEDVEEALRGEPPKVAVRTINGWAYAAPGDYIVMGSEWFSIGPDHRPHDQRALRDFYPCDPETFKTRWEPAP